MRAAGGEGDLARFGITHVTSGSVGYCETHREMNLKHAWWVGMLRKIPRPHGG